MRTAGACGHAGNLIGLSMNPGDPIGPLVWWKANVDLMVFCLVIAFTASGIAIFLKNARGSSIAVALLSSFLFVSLGIPFLAIEYKWYWTSLAITSALIGFGSLTLAWTAMKVSTVIQNKFVDDAGHLVSRALRSDAASGTPPAPPSDAPPPTALPEKS